MPSKCVHQCMACNTSRWLVQNPSANIASSIMDESIGKACLCPSFLRTQIAIIRGTYGFYGKRSQSSQRSGTNKPRLNNPQSKEGPEKSVRKLIKFKGFTIQQKSQHKLSPEWLTIFQYFVCRIRLPFTLTQADFSNIIFIFMKEDLGKPY